MHRHFGDDNKNRKLYKMLSKSSDFRKIYRFCGFSHPRLSVGMMENGVRKLRCIHAAHLPFQRFESNTWC